MTPMEARAVAMALCVEWLENPAEWIGSIAPLTSDDRDRIVVHVEVVRQSIDRRLDEIRTRYGIDPAEWIGTTSPPEPAPWTQLELGEVDE